MQNSQGLMWWLSLTILCLQVLNHGSSTSHTAFCLWPGKEQGMIESLGPLHLCER